MEYTLEQEEIKHYDIKQKLIDNGVPEEEHERLQSLYNEKMYQIYLRLSEEKSGILYNSLQRVGVDALKAIFDLSTIKNEEIQKLYEEAVNLTKGIV